MIPLSSSALIGLIIVLFPCIIVRVNSPYQKTRTCFGVFTLKAVNGFLTHDQVILSYNRVIVGSLEIKEE